MQFIELKDFTASVGGVQFFSNFVLYENPIRVLMFITMILGSFSCLS